MVINKTVKRPIEVLKKRKDVKREVAEMNPADIKAHTGFFEAILGDINLSKTKSSPNKNKGKLK
jgi:hypothetical protein